MRGQIRIRGEGRQEKAPDLAQVMERLDRILGILTRPPWWKGLWSRIKGACRWQ